VALFSLAEQVYYFSTPSRYPLKSGISRCLREIHAFPRAPHRGIQPNPADFNIGITDAEVTGVQDDDAFLIFETQ
jgi:hypothetical protein